MAGTVYLNSQNQKKKVVLYGDRELVIEMYRLYTFKTHQAIYI